MERTLACLLLGLIMMPMPAAFAIDITPATGSGDAATLAGALVDTGSPITVNSANFLIDVVGGGTVESELRAIASFTNGNAGGQLPPINQLDPQDPITYAGGIGLNAGVCLCTGLVTDADSEGANAKPGSGVGVQGPNNGFPLSAFFAPPPESGQTPLNAGELSYVTNTPRDRDFAAVKTVDPNNEGDATVLQFQISVSVPGFLRISFVFASDEHPFWLNRGQFDVNDTVAILVRKDSCSNAVFENIALLKAPGQPDGPISLRELRDCGPIMFKNNQIAPAPDDDLIPEKQIFDFPTSDHGFDTNFDNFNRPDDGVPYYNHEFGGFSKKLTRETPYPISPGTYTIKIVVQDVFDRKVDSAVFVEAGSLKLFTLQQGDYDGSGCVDSADYDVWRANYGRSPATFYHGDGNGDCIVDTADYVTWRNNLGMSGNTDFRADFNRDGQVNGTDLSIFGTYYNVLTHCASRFEGDADGDGDVDDADFGILSGEYDSMSCGCNCGESAMGGGGDLTSLQEQLPESPDVNGDGTVDETDLAAIDAIIAAWKAGDTSAAETSDDSMDSMSAESFEPTPALDSTPARLSR